MCNCGGHGHRMWMTVMWSGSWGCRWLAETRLGVESCGGRRGGRGRGRGQGEKHFFQLINFFTREGLYLVSDQQLSKYKGVNLGLDKKERRERGWWWEEKKTSSQHMFFLPLPIKRFPQAEDLLRVQQNASIASYPSLQHKQKQKSTPMKAPLE